MTMNKAPRRLGEMGKTAPPDGMQVAQTYGRVQSLAIHTFQE
jgi:hypothetical protein